SVWLPKAPALLRASQIEYSAEGAAIEDRSSEAAFVRRCGASSATCEAYVRRSGKRAQCLVYGSRIRKQPCDIRIKDNCDSISGETGRIRIAASVAEIILGENVVFGDNGRCCSWLTPRFLPSHGIRDASRVGG